MKHVFLVTLLLLLAVVSFPQKPASINNIKQLTDSIQVIMQQDHITGLMLGITTKDSVLLAGGFGYADLNSDRKVDKSTLFRLGSITKMFVSIAIMKLVNEGKLKLDDELKKIAPEVPFKNKWELTNPLRIVHLLEHTSGFDDIKLNRLYSTDGKELSGIDMMLVQKNSMVCRWKTGERFAYSNPNYAILGYIIEKLSGKSYDEYLTEHILKPLGMTSSNFNVGSKFPGKDVKEYIVKDGRSIQVPSVTLLSGAQGALWSNAEDMVKFLQLFLQNSDSGSIKEIETTHSSLAARTGQTNGYALGNNNTFFTNAKYPFRGHGGLAGTCYSSCNYNRELNIGFVIASNSNNTNYRVEELIVEYLEQNLPKKELTTQPLDITAIQPYLGRYQFESPRNMISGFSDKLQNAPLIILKDGKLYLKPLMGTASELVQTGQLTFAWKGSNMPLLCFTKNDNGKNVMLIGGIYYEQTSNAWAIGKRIAIIIAFLFIMSSVILGIASLIAVVTGKLKWRHALPRLLPMIGFGLLVWALLHLLDVQQHTYKLYELGRVNFRTMVIFWGTSLFAVISIATLFFATIAFRNPERLWFKIYFLLTAISFCLVTVILWQAGWVGLRTWAM